MELTAAVTVGECAWRAGVGADGVRALLAAATAGGGGGRARAARQLVMPCPSNMPPLAPRAAAVNDAPTASGTPAAKTTAEDTPATFSAAELTAGAADTDNTPAELAVGAITGQPSNGKAVKDAAGAITYTPRANFFGADSFKYTVTDGALSVELTAAVTVG